MIDIFNICRALIRRTPYDFEVIFGVSRIGDDELHLPVLDIPIVIRRRAPCDRGIALEAADEVEGICARRREQQAFIGGSVGLPLACRRTCRSLRRDGDAFGGFYDVLCNILCLGVMILETSSTV